jgi:hypothetical protein
MQSNFNITLISANYSDNNIDSLKPNRKILSLLPRNGSRGWTHELISGGASHPPYNESSAAIANCGLC